MMKVEVVLLLVWVSLFRILVKIFPNPLHKLAQSVLKDKSVFLSKEKNTCLKPRNNQLFVTWLFSRF